MCRWSASRPLRQCERPGRPGSGAMPQSACCSRGTRLFRPQTTPALASSQARERATGGEERMIAQPFPQLDEIARITDQLKRAFDGEAWHGDSLMEILADVDAKTAA